MPLTPEERSLRASAAAHAKWAKTDPKEHGDKIRAAQLERFANEVDPDQELDDVERRRRARHLQRSHMQRLALKSAKARRLRANGGDAA